MNELRNLWHFVQVAHAGSFTSAALRLSVSTAALSKSIARLEKRMGMRLFVRTSRTLHLTEEGRRLLEGVSNAFGVIEDSLEGMSQDDSEPAGIVRLSSVTAYGKHCLLPLLPQFLTRYPKIDLVLSFHDGQRGLTRQAFDIRINWGEEREQGKVAQRLCQMPLVLVASPEYLARRGTPRRPENLENHDCINVALASGVRAHWNFVPRHGRSSGRGRSVAVAPHGRIIVMDELDAVADAAELGLGLTVSSAENVLMALRQGTLVRVLPDWDVAGDRSLNNEVIIQYPRKKLLPPRIRALVDCLLENLRGRDPLSLVTANRSKSPHLQNAGAQI